MHANMLIMSVYHVFHPSLVCQHPISTKHKVQLRLMGISVVSQEFNKPKILDKLKV